jgi:hypothetical protein
MASRFENPQPAAVPIETRTWLQVPDGRFVPAQRRGADGAQIIPAGASHNFGPLAVMGVASDTARGSWEFGCRILHPVTGHQLDEDADRFEIR